MNCICLCVFWWLEFVLIQAEDGPGRLCLESGYLLDFAESVHDGPGACPSQLGPNMEPRGYLLVLEKGLEPILNDRALRNFKFSCLFLVLLLKLLDGIVLFGRSRSLSFLASGFLLTTHLYFKL